VRACAAGSFSSFTSVGSSTTLGSGPSEACNLELLAKLSAAPNASVDCSDAHGEAAATDEVYGGLDDHAARDPLQPAGAAEDGFTTVPPSLPPSEEASLQSDEGEVPPTAFKPAGSSSTAPGFQAEPSTPSFVIEPAFGWSRSDRVTE